MRNFLKKAIKERWHKHAGYSAIITVIALFFCKVEGNTLNVLLGFPFALGLFGYFWEAYHEKENNAEFSWSDIAANAVGAFVGGSIYLIIYHLAV